MRPTAENMLNDALSAYTYDAENRLPPETWNCLAVLRVPTSSREAVIAATWV